jgi:hypothetical protein
LAEPKELAKSVVLEAKIFEAYLKKKLKNPGNPNPNLEKTKMKKLDIIQETTLAGRAGDKRLSALMCSKKTIQTSTDR